MKKSGGVHKIHQGMCLSPFLKLSFYSSILDAIVCSIQGAFHSLSFDAKRKNYQAVGNVPQ